MTRSIDRAELERECDAFCRYLTGAEATDSVRAKYVEAHAVGAVEVAGARTDFDRALVRFALRGRLAARFADSHARLFRSGGLLHRKLVLTLAILEAHGDTTARVDAPTASGPNAFVFELIARLIGFALVVVVGLAIFLPLRALASFGSSGGGA